MIRQLPLPFPHAPDFARSPFVEAPSNAEALTWLERDQVWPSHRLAIWGEAGCGKSHLLFRWAQRERALLHHGPSLSLATVPPTTAIAIDDADLCAERPLLHLLNAAAEAGLPVLLAGREAPSRWATGLADLASRLRATTAVRIRPAEDALLQRLLALLFADRQLSVAEPLQEMLLLHLPRAPQALREAVSRLDRMALAAGHRITRPLVQQMLIDWDQAPGSDDSVQASHLFNEDFAQALAAASPADPGFL